MLPADLLIPEDSLAHAFNIISNRIGLTLQAMYRQRFGLSASGYRILVSLGSRYPLSAKTLSEVAAMDRVNVSRAIEQLTRKKLVSRCVDRADRRRAALRLTDKGEEVYNQIVPVLYASEKALVSGLGEDELVLLRRIMRSLVDGSARALGGDCNWQAPLDVRGVAAMDVGRTG